MENKGMTDRERRHKRRVQAQIRAYITAGVLLVIVGTGVFFGGRTIVGKFKAYEEYKDAVLNKVDEELTPTSDYLSPDELVTVEQESTVPAEPEPDPLEDLAKTLLQDMTLEEKVAGLFVVTPESITGVSTAIQAGDTTKKAIEENPVGGLIYAEKNYKADKFQAMISNTRSYAKYPLFIMVNCESGENASFGVGNTTVAGAFDSEESVTNTYLGIADKLAQLGINMNLAPVVDLQNVEENNKSFGNDPEQTGKYAQAAVTALQSKDVSAAILTFPGEGGVKSETGITKSLEEMKNSDFLVYDKLIKAGVDCIVVSNEKTTDVSEDNKPCALSHAVITDILRNTLGYQGLVMTDYLNAGAIKGNYSSKSAAVNAILAGADVLLCPEDYKEAYAGVLEAITEGTITQERIDESMIRILKVKYKHALDGQ